VNFVWCSFWAHKNCSGFVTRCTRFEEIRKGLRGRIEYVKEEIREEMREGREAIREIREGR